MKEELCASIEICARTIINEETWGKGRDLEAFIRVKSLWSVLDILQRPRSSTEGRRGGEGRGSY